MTSAGMATSDSKRYARRCAGTSRKTSGRTSCLCVIEVHDTTSKVSIARLVIISGDVFLSLLLKKEIATKSFLSLRCSINAADCFVVEDSVKSIRPLVCLLASDDKNEPMLKSMKSWYSLGLQPSLLSGPCESGSKTLL